MENEEILQEEESNILTLTDENGVDTDFEYLDSIDYEGKEYLCMLTQKSIEASFGQWARIWYAPVSMSVTHIWWM